METVPGRSKYWFIWPTFYTEKDARDIAKAGATACAIVAAISAFSTHGGGRENAEIEALLYILVFGTFGYFTLKLNRVVATLSFLLFAADKVYTIIVTAQAGKAPVIGIFILLYLFHAMRAAYWYHGGRNAPKPEAETPESPRLS